MDIKKQQQQNEVKSIIQTKHTLEVSDQNHYGSW